ncbi:MAG: hypothetical protein ACR2ND_15780 [Solirubrobacteraceae bacterium]
MHRGTLHARVALSACCVLAGCGGAAQQTRVVRGAQPSGSGIPTIRSWSEALTRSDLLAASALFAIPSLAQIDPAGPVGRITRAADARALDESLPCGAKLLDARPRGRYVDALFLLTQRPGVRCDGPGGTARVAFRIAAGKIAEWRRLPDEAGDSSRGTAPSPQPQPQPTVPGVPSPGNPTTTPSPQQRSV